MKTLRKSKIHAVIKQISEGGRVKSHPQLEITEKGLTEAEAEKRLQASGRNDIVAQPKPAPFRIFFRYFQNPLILILLVASIISGLLGEARSAIVIAAIIFFSIALDYFQEQKSSHEAEKLREKLSLTSTVIRSGKKVEIDTRLIVPGDIVMLSAGDIVPADAKIIKSDDLYANESSLTGESYPVEKYAGAVEHELLFAGSNIVSGYAFAEVTKTGTSTKFGQVAAMTEMAEPQTAFEKGISEFGYFIIKLTSMVVSIVFLISIIKPFFYNQGLTSESLINSILFALAIAVGLTPELLPMIMSINMAKGSLRMAHKGVIVKRLDAIPDFGSIDILCTDKTGTLTEGVVTLVKYLDPQGNSSERALFLGYVNSYLQTGLKNPLDAAIIKVSAQHGKIKKIDEIPYDFNRKRLSIAAVTQDGPVLITKGQPEEMLKIISGIRSGNSVAHANPHALESAKMMYQKLSEDGFRVLFIASKPLSGAKTKTVTISDESHMVLEGMLAFYDPPKSTVAKTIKDIYRNTIHIKIITGDNELVTKKICTEIGMEVHGIMTGEEVAHSSHEALAIHAEKTTIFARCTPAEKTKIISALRSRGHVVGYIGDGINDAPSLKAADVGISVNNAVDVAKESADIILLKKSLRQLNDGILEGRVTFGNTMKYLMMGISSNFGNMFSLIFAVIYLPFLPMLSYQVLLNNLLYDVSQTTIPSDSVDPEYLRKPKHWDITFIKRFMYIFGPISSVFDVLTFIVLYKFAGLVGGAFQAGWFIESLATQTFVVYIIRTVKIPFLQSRPSRLLTISTLGVVLAGLLIILLPIRSYFDFESLPLPMLAIIGAMVILYLVIVEIVKQWFYRSKLSNSTNNL